MGGYVFVKNSENLEVCFRGAYAKAAAQHMHRENKPLGFHNFSQTPNPRFCTGNDEFLVAIEAFLGSPNP